MSMIGGLGTLEGASPESFTLSNQIKYKAEKAAGKTFASFYPILLRKQVVQGTNYFMKVNVGQGDYVHIGVHELSHEDHVKLTLLGVETGKTLEDPIEAIKAGQ